VKLKKLIKNAREISEPYRVTKGKNFRLKDVDPEDTGPNRGQVLQSSTSRRLPAHGNRPDVTL